jgi:hypothetical protein
MGLFSCGLRFVLNEISRGGHEMEWCGIRSQLVESMMGNPLLENSRARHFTRRCVGMAGAADGGYPAALEPTRKMQGQPDQTDHSSMGGFP